MRVKSTRSCVICGREFQPHAGRPTNRYCSKPCFLTVRSRPAEVRFWEKVEKTDECWNWTGAKQWTGRGSFGLAGRQTILAPRFSYQLHFGPIPNGLNVLHRCDNPACVRPDHLFLGTQQDNVADMWTKGRGPIGDQRGTITHPERIIRGEQHPKAVLTEELVKTLRDTYAAGGITMAALAVRYQVHERTIHGAITRRTWKHVL